MGEEVAKWADGMKGVSSASKDAFKQAVMEYSITGNILNMIEDSHLQEEAGLTSELERKSILEAIQKLTFHPTGKNVSMSFWELRSLNRKLMDHTVTLLSVSPRSAMTKLKEFPEYVQVPPQMGWATWIFAPEYHIWEHRKTILNGLPGIFPHTLAFNCLYRYVMIAWHVKAVVDEGNKPPNPDG